jgi:NADH-quinone oxidoreductase subunit K
MFSIEIMYFGVTLGFLIISATNVDILGQIYSLIILILAAAESAVGLGLLIVLYRFGFTIKHKDYQTLRG